MSKQFTQEELESIRSIQESYNTLGIQLIQLKLALKNAEEYFTELKEKEAELETKLVEINKQEKELAAHLDEKYGSGSLDLETGQFTPKDV